MLDHPRMTLSQFAEGLHPVEGARSTALETRVRHGQVRNLAALEAFVREHLEASIAPFEGVAVAVAARLGAAADVDGALRLDTELDAAFALDAFEPSRRRGRAALRAALGFTPSPSLAAFQRQVERAETPGHHAVVFGFVAGSLGASPEGAAHAYLEASAAALVSAARRLLAITEAEGDNVRWSLDDCVSRLSAEAARKDVGDLVSTAPRFEMAALRLAARDARRFPR
jgi:urease accessory protein